MKAIERPEKTRPETGESEIDRVRRKQQAVRDQLALKPRSAADLLGMIEDTPISREAFDLGEAYRRAQREP
jgi:hypothetical protein